MPWARGVRAAFVKLTALAVLLQLLTACDHGDRVRSDDPFAKARRRIERLMKERNVVSLQVAVARDGKILYAEAFGWANVEEHIRTTPETMHLVASIAKPFTSTALMILAEQGRIDLHGPINDYLGGSKLIAYQGKAADAAVARMLLHTTGLPYGYYVCGDERPPAERRTTKDLLALAGVLVCAPGTRYQYTNLGYGLLDDVVHDVSAVNIEEFIQKEIIAPLGLKHTGFFRSPPPWDRIATQNFEGGVLPVSLNADGYTGLYSTASDLARFGMFHMKAHLPDQQPILSDSGIDLLWQYRDPGVESTTRRLAWDVQQDYGFETVQHGGGGPGIHNWLYMIPSEKVVIALMSNAWYSNSHSDPVLLELIAAAVSEPGQRALRRWAGRGWPRAAEPKAAAFKGRWAGRIEGPKGGCLMEVDFDSRGNPRMCIERDNSGKQRWISPNRKVSKGHKSLLWRFDAHIPYLHPYAPHDEVILTLWPQGDKLIGSASAAKEKDFGKGENYVLPQYLELARSGD
jgi:CubicO group peptidase (beta-lactamase class C family)